MKMRENFLGFHLVALHKQGWAKLCKPTKSLADVKKDPQKH